MKGDMSLDQTMRILIAIAVIAFMVWIALTITGGLRT